MPEPEKTPIRLRVESFEKLNPKLLPDIFAQPARAVLAKHHRSPAEFKLFANSGHRDGRVEFESPDPRTAESLEPRRLTEHAAILMAGLMLPEFEGLQITRVIPIGKRVDYFVGNSSTDDSFVLEVGGTEEGSLAGLRTEKLAQAGESPYRKPPYSKTAFVSVTRFAADAGSILERVFDGEKGGA